MSETDPLGATIGFRPIGESSDRRYHSAGNSYCNGLIGDASPWFAADDFLRVKDCRDTPRSERNVDQRRMERMSQRTSVQKVLRSASAASGRIEEVSYQFLQRRRCAVKPFLVTNGTCNLFGTHQLLHLLRPRGGCKSHSEHRGGIGGRVLESSFLIPVPCKLKRPSR